MDGSFEGPPPPPRAPSRRGHLRHRTKSSDTFPDPISNPWPISTAESQGDRRLLPSYGDPSFGLIYPFFSKSQIEASKRNPKKPPNEEMTERQEGQQDGESSPQPSSSTAQQPFELRQSLSSPERSSNTSYGQVPTVSGTLQGTTLPVFRLGLRESPLIHPNAGFPIPEHNPSYYNAHSGSLVPQQEPVPGRASFGVVLNDGFGTPTPSSQGFGPPLPHLQFQSYHGSHLSSIPPGPQYHDHAGGFGSRVRDSVSLFPGTHPQAAPGGAPGIALDDDARWMLPYPRPISYQYSTIADAGSEVDVDLDDKELDRQFNAALRREAQMRAARLVDTRNHPVGANPGPRPSNKGKAPVLALPRFLPHQQVQVLKRGTRLLKILQKAPGGQAMPKPIGGDRHFPQNGTHLQSPLAQEFQQSAPRWTGGGHNSSIQAAIGLQVDQVADFSSIASTLGDAGSLAPSGLASFRSRYSGENNDRHLAPTSFNESLVGEPNTLRVAMKESPIRFQRFPTTERPKDRRVSAAGFSTGIIDADYPSSSDEASVTTLVAVGEPEIPDTSAHGEGIAVQQGPAVLPWEECVSNQPKSPPHDPSVSYFSSSQESGPEVTHDDPPGGGGDDKPVRSVKKHLSRFRSMLHLAPRPGRGDREIGDGVNENEVNDGEVAERRTKSALGSRGPGEFASELRRPNRVQRLRHKVSTWSIAAKHAITRNQPDSP